MQQVFLLILFAIAVYYLYRKLVKNRGCDCSGKGCCTPPQLPKKKPEENQ